MKREYIFVGKAAFFPKEKMLVFADLHLGYEEQAVGSGRFLHLRIYEQIKKDIGMIFDFLKEKEEVVEKIVILGDVKHEFSGILGGEEREILRFVEYLKGKLAFDGKIILVKGNHDNYVSGILKRKNIGVVEKMIAGENLFIHGDELENAFDVKNKNVKRIFLGHIHPAVVLEMGAKKERYKCFLVGKYKGGEIIILPSFFPLVEGIDISAIEKKLKIKNKKVYVVVPYSVEVLEI